MKKIKVCSYLKHVYKLNSLNLYLNMKNKNVENFNPVLFLMSLGAGGLAISLWAFLMFTIEHGKGMIHTGQVHEIAGGSSIIYLYMGIEILAAIMGIIHFITLFWLLGKFFKWKKTSAYQKYMENPLVNNSIMAVFLTIDMAFNVVFALGNHFILKNGEWFQLVMGPALIGWAILYAFAIGFSIKVLKIAFTKEFDMDKMHFGFLIHPFALAMIGVTGFGIAAFAQNFVISSIAFFMSLVPFAVAIMLTIVKLVAMFLHHFKNNLPDRNFLPSTLIVMPIFMLSFVSLFRMGHYINHQFGIEISPAYYIMITVIPFAFLNWYAIFGIALIKDYFKNFKDFNVSQWAFICPIAAYVVIGFFANKYWLGVFDVLSYFLLIVAIFGLILYFNLFFKQIITNIRN